MCAPCKSDPQARGPQSKGDGKGRGREKSKGKDRSECKPEGKGKDKDKDESNRKGKEKEKGESKGRTKVSEEAERKASHKHKHKQKQKSSISTKCQNKVPRITHWGIPLTTWPRFIMRPPVIGQHLSKATTRDHSGTKRFSQLHLYSHTPEQIASAILSAPSRSQTKKRARAIKQYHELLTRCSDNSDDHHQHRHHHPEDADLLFQFLQLFDQIFFHGSLTGLCYVRVVKHLGAHDDDDNEGDCATVGSEEFPHFKYRYEAQMRILDVRGRDRYGQSTEERLHQYLETLIHERVHAVLGLYTCMLHSACRERDRRVVGRDGHLSVWQEITHGIETATEGLLGGGRRFDLGRRVGLGADLAGSRGVRMPTREQLARWSLDPREVMREVEARR